MLFHIFVETKTFFMDWKFKRTAFTWNINLWSLKVKVDTLALLYKTILTPNFWKAVYRLIYIFQTPRPTITTLELQKRRFIQNRDKCRLCFRLVKSKITDLQQSNVHLKCLQVTRSYAQPLADTGPGKSISLYEQTYSTSPDCFKWLSRANLAKNRSDG